MMIGSQERKTLGCLAPALCHYRNKTPQLQVVRLFHRASLRMERVIFPGENWLFEADPEAELQVQMKGLSHGMFVERLWCDRLRVKPLPTSV
ncbi:MAG: DUF1830 domain-containing protein [Leptolyngbyaceae cyanobacterium bins.349]|nr:DUF1830 domain-containing protein [Leptolyngbyaceae cyanobacterium bins.349]